MGISKITSKRNIKKKGKRFNDDLKNFRVAYKKNISVYQEISNSTNIPSKLIAAIHFREDSDDCLQGNFRVLFKNGTLLAKPSKKKFKEKAIMELKKYKIYRTKYGKEHSWKHHPYVFSGTNLYKKGKFTSDGIYNSSTDIVLYCKIRLGYETILGYHFLQKMFDF